jgi:hypothetical protein
MTATMKSRVLTREEKGIGGVSMKRLIFCGMGGGVVYFILNLSPLSMCSLPSLLVVFVTLIMASGQRHGISRYQWLLLTLQGRTLLHADQHPTGLTRQWLNQFDMPIDNLHIHGGDLFVGATLSDTDLSGIQILNNDQPDAFEFEVLHSDEIPVEVI